jgi:outer membrane protein assembly factor BamB
MRLVNGDRGRILLSLFAGVSLAAATPSEAADWSQWLGNERDGVWHESGLLDKFPEGGPDVIWRVPVGAGYSGPAVVGEHVYVMDREQRGDEPDQPPPSGAKGIPGSERVLCLSAADGQVVWKYEYDCPYTISYPTGPRTTPLVHEGRVYTLGAMGDLACLNADDGTVQWSENLLAKYRAEVPIWGCAAHPLLDGDLLYCLVGGKESAVVALDKDTGQEVWKALGSIEVGYSPPMIYEIDGRRQLIIWLSEAIYGLDPTTGQQLWRQDYPEHGPPQRPAVNIITVKNIGNLLYLSTFYHGPLMVKVEALAAPHASVAWSGEGRRKNRTEGPHCLMASPVFKDGFGYAVGREGELRCFRTDNGEELWQSYAPVVGKPADCGTVFIVPQGERSVLFNDQGELILAHLSPEGYREIDRARILEPVTAARGRQVVWSHPAFARRCVFARNDEELVCVSMAANG